MDDDECNREVPHLGGICTRIRKLPGIVRDLESYRNNRSLDLETLFFHGIEEYALYFSLMQGGLVWISCGRGCYIGYTSYALTRVELRRGKSQQGNTSESAYFNSSWTWVIECLQGDRLGSKAKKKKNLLHLQP
jgi:hypothetical protein